MSTVAAPTISVAVPEVSRGAAWLDENVPGWWKRIDLESLDLRSCELCVSGQLALERIFYEENAPDLYPDLTRFPSQLGFEAGPSNTYQGLQVAWEAEILRRRETAC